MGVKDNLQETGVTHILEVKVVMERLMGTFLCDSDLFHKFDGRAKLNLTCV